MGKIGVSERFRRTPVTVTIHTATEDQSEAETSETYQGQLYEGKRKNFLIYEEQVEEGGAIQSTITFNDQQEKHEVKIIRHGAVEMNQVFQAGESIIGAYRTPLGKFNMETTTYICEITRINNGGNITLEYDVKLNGQPMGKRTVKIQFQIIHS
ncbi:DUF1934 domain-containing protein [Bacillus horti]|uniref:Uncharacterized beta-barrel protein YwiB (DUF1934 family) n=1 Tax=Caldalkalibacillus horti TaxID=77523 RepID=A0ABT9VVS0_9BACI|nr:DUF1934 domain-containing protein [Bacillus horti]MDQ0165091.1 uncharacterized beta-barrel protein YwiB (DUF1934 family) [Bacillus horti]